MSVRNLVVALSLMLGGMLSVATPATAATIQVGFSFSSVTGVLTFDALGDVEANSVELTSNEFGEQSEVFNASTANNFTWAGDAIVQFTFVSFKVVDRVFFELRMSTFGSALYCTDFDLAGRCDGKDFDDRNGLTTFYYPSSEVPAPAALPLFLTGIAGLAGLKLRRRRPAQV